VPPIDVQDVEPSNDQPTVGDADDGTGQGNSAEANGPQGERDQSDSAQGDSAEGASGGHRRDDALALPDAVCAAAVGLALEAVVEVAAPGEVGEHTGVVAEGERLVTHWFACLARGYQDWRWAVTLARAPRARAATVCEVVLLPSPEAILAPAWVPWSDRIAPGDLGSTDVLPYRADDPDLEQGYEPTGEEDSDELALWELGLGRVRVLSPQGRRAAAERWYLGDHGPSAESAVLASATCAGCGYFMPMAGALRRAFGVCANEWSPSDGSVVSLDHGCGAHSETDIERALPEPLPLPVLDETGAEAVVVPRRSDLVAGSEPVVGSDPVVGSEPVGEAVSEPEGDPASS